MVEIVFSGNVAGSIAVAQNHPKSSCGATGVVILRKDRKKPSKLALWLAKRKAERENQEKWERSVTLEGKREDILCFPLGLSVGQIREDVPGKERARAFEILNAGWRKDTDKRLEEANANLAALLERAKKGETLRIWSSREPDEACGLCWILDQLRVLGFENLRMTLVMLPEREERRDGVTVRYRGWGDAGPDELGRLALQGKTLSPEEAGKLADHWRKLKAENAPLRAVEHGLPVSVAEDHYDSYILQELERQPEQFREVVLIGEVLGRYQLGIGDGFVHSRVEKFIGEGRLAPVTEAAPGEIAYRRTLRKRKSPA